MRRAAAVATILLALPWGAAGVQALPEECRQLDSETYSCVWTIPPGTVGVQERDFPAFSRTLASFTVTLLQAPDTGWEILLHQRSSAENASERVSRASHPPSAEASNRHQERTTHVLVGEPEDTYWLAFNTQRIPAPATTDCCTILALGTYEIAYIGRSIPEGVLPERPAATRADPQLVDLPDDADHAAWDILATWFDDPRLGDGLFDVQLAVTDLARLDDAAFRTPSNGRATDPLVDALAWKVAWSSRDVRYYVEWSVAKGDRDNVSCEVRREATSEGEIEPLLVHPRCTMDRTNSTLLATIPEASVGAPPDGALFDQIEARTRVHYAERRATDVVDDTADQRYAFALGGPAAWSALNPRLDPPPVLWYQAPLAPAHVADTLQVLGSLAALATFLVGVVLVARRRRRTSVLLGRVDVIADAALPANETLLALGRLEEEFTTLFRRHKITDAQYQVLTQRIAGVATRFALRTQLGLDDGVPGEGVVRVTVQDMERKRPPA